MLNGEIVAYKPMMRGSHPYAEIMIKDGVGTFRATDGHRILQNGIEVAKGVPDGSYIYPLGQVIDASKGAKNTMAIRVGLHRKDVAIKVEPVNAGAVILPTLDVSYPDLDRVTIPVADHVVRISGEALDVIKKLRDSDAKKTVVRFLFEERMVHVWGDDTVLTFKSPFRWTGDQPPDLTFKAYYLKAAIKRHDKLEFGVSDDRPDQVSVNGDTIMQIKDAEDPFMVMPETPVAVEAEVAPITLIQRLREWAFSWLAKIRMFVRRHVRA